MQVEMETYGRNMAVVAADEVDQFGQFLVQFVVDDQVKWRGHLTDKSDELQDDDE